MKRMVILISLMIFLAGCTIVWLPYADDENSKGANIVKIEKRK